MRAALGWPPVPSLVGLSVSGNLIQHSFAIFLLTLSLSFLLCLSVSLCLSVLSPLLPMEVPNSAPGPNIHNSFSLLFSMASLWLHSHQHPHPALCLSSFWVSVSDCLFVPLSLLLVFLPSVSPASVIHQQVAIDHSFEARHGPAPFWVLCVFLPLCCRRLSPCPRRPPALPSPSSAGLQHWCY